MSRYTLVVGCFSDLVHKAWYIATLVSVPLLLVLTAWAGGYGFWGWLKDRRAGRRGKP